jgi:3-oxoacyl-[acyl-carrier-protein] synthase-3
VDVFLIGSAVALPPRAYTNHEVGERIGLDRGKIDRLVELTGVRSRGFSWDLATEERLVTSDELAGRAAEEALRSAGLQAGDVELVVTASSAPDCLMPSQAALVLQHLGIDQCASISLFGGCSAFVDALIVTRSFLLTGMARTAVVIGTESITSWVPTMRTAFDAMIFGDASGAFVLSVAPNGSADHPVYRLEDAFMATRSTIDDEPADVFRVPMSAHRIEPTQVGPGGPPGPVDPYMRSWRPEIPDGHRPFHNARQALAGAVPGMMEAFGRVTRDTPGPGVVVPHQGSRTVIDGVAKSVPPGWDVVDNLAHRGNLSSASVPVAFHEHLDRCMAADDVVLVTVGVGLSFGAVRLRQLSGRH